MSETIIFVFMIVLILSCTVMAYFSIKKQAAEQGTEVTLKKAIKAGCKIPKPKDLKRLIKLLISFVVFIAILIVFYTTVYNTHLETCPLNHNETCECAICEAQSHSENCGCNACSEFKGIFKERHSQECGYIECVINHDENCNKGECVCICECKTCDKLSPRVLIMQIPIFVLFMIGMCIMINQKVELADRMAESLNNNNKTY
jgi:uncharacterized membrane protein (DUF373 family)